ncbi:MAG: restriction endonuclease subunit S [Alphaproteobacteria bacterium HGW-Alphaproteobacteria-1]|jgi:type I restriction enzyme S subunit|nr:MAG: restriction endonuclease subunit S [Alphaproteobacteria bacterium HGW-Alphaproteobacteria-1]
MKDGTFTADRLLALYGRVAEAEDAIPRLRRFVLDLAVRGKLVEQDPSDEPAAELLKRIAKEKARLVKAKVIRKPRDTVTLEADDLPFPLPRGWTWTQIGQLGVISPRNEADDDSEASFVPMPLIAAEYGVANGQEARPWGEIKKGYTHFAEGDVGLAKITPCFENGKSTVFRGLIGGIGAGTTELHIVRPIFVDADYILLFLKCPHFIETGIPKMTGTAGQKRVPTEYFTSSPFPLPPLAEQRRIVAKVDELMALCDQLQAARAGREGVRDRLTAATLARLTAPETDAETFPTHARFALQTLPTLTTRAGQIKTLRQTILNLAVRGKLVTQDAGDEPINATLAKALARRAALVRAKKVRLKKLDGYDDLAVDAALPPSWTVERLGNLVDPENTISYGVLVPGNEVPDGIPFVRAQDLALTGHPDRPNKTIDPEIERPYARTRLRGGEILVCVVGSIGKLGIVPQSWAGANIARAVARIMPIPEISQEYLLLVLRGEPAQTYFTETTRTLAQPTLNVGLIEQTPIPLPPLAEQRRIVARVDALMALCDQLESSLTTAATTRSRLLDALLHEALNGAAA